MNEIENEGGRIGCEGGTPRDRRNRTRLLWTSVIWALCLVGAAYLIENDLVPAGPVAWLVASLPIIAGLVALATYSRFLRETDELQRLIQLEALGLGFGLGWVAMSSYPILEKLGAPAIDASIYVAVMAISYTIGNVIGWRRYR